MDEITDETLKHMKGCVVSFYIESSNSWKFRVLHVGPPANNNGRKIRDVVPAAFRVRV